MDDSVFQSVYETILERDTRYDGVYYVGITSTGIYCRPSCRSRTPKPENVRVFNSIESAEESGFRACKRCRPDHPGMHGPDSELAQAVIQLVRDRYAEGLTLAELSSALTISPYHLQRVFKRTTGITPAKLLLQTRMKEAKAMLGKKDKAIQDIALAVGFRSASHFSHTFQKTVGMTPNEYREGRR